jgi:hypothetical protein
MDEFHGDAELLELEIQMDDARPFEVWAAEFADWHGEDRRDWRTYCGDS